MSSDRFCDRNLGRVRIAVSPAVVRLAAMVRPSAAGMLIEPPAIGSELLVLTQAGRA